LLDEIGKYEGVKYRLKRSPEVKEHFEVRIFEFFGETLCSLVVIYQSIHNAKSHRPIGALQKSPAKSFPSPELFCNKNLTSSSDRSPYLAGRQGRSLTVSIFSWLFFREKNYILKNFSISL
jgi:hypothetical protein